MRKIIRDQVAASMAEFMANMNRGTGDAGTNGVKAGGARTGGAETGGAGTGGAETDGVGTGGAEAGGAEDGGAGPVVPEINGCTYVIFMKCNPRPFKGIEGAVGLCQWFEKLESVFQISDCKEKDKIKVEQYIRGLSKNIRGDVTSSSPASIDEAIRMTYQLMGHIIQDKTDVAPEGEKRKVCPNCKNKKHAVDCWKYGKCGKLGHKTATCRCLDRKDVTCFNCNEKGHLQRDCLKLKKNRQGGNNRGAVYKLGAVDAQQDPKAVTGTFLLNNRYATTLFDLGADKSFVSTKFSTLIDSEPVKLDTFYDVKLADGKVVSTNNVLIGCTLTLLNHSFPIDLMVIELGSFDIIIGMDWLSRYDAAILYQKRKVRIPLEGKTLVIKGNRNNSRLKIVSCIKAQKYIENGCELFLAQVTKQGSKEKRLEDDYVIRDFPEVFPNELPGLPPPRQVEFHIDLIPGAAPVAPAPYRLAPSEMKELSEKLWELSKKGDDEEEAFQTLKLKLCSSPILSLLEGSEDFVVYCDASLKGFGAVLMQREKVITWIELLSDYDHVIRYHPRKANVVADELSRKDKEPIRVRALVVTVHNNLPEQIRNAQVEACKEENIGVERFVGEGEPFEVRSVVTLKPARKKILVSKDSLAKGSHLKLDPMVRGARVDYFGPRPSFRVKFLEIFTEVVRDKFRYEYCYHPQTDGQSERTIQTLEDMLRACVIDFGSGWDKHLPLAEFSYNNNYHASIKATPFEALYRRKCRSPVCWSEVVDAQLTRPEMISETTKMIVQIKNRLLATRSRQKSYADMRCKPLEFEVGDKVMLKLSPCKGPMAYKLELPRELQGIHNTFHVSNLKKCLSDEDLIIPLDEVRIDEKLHFIEEPVEIMDREGKKLKQSRIPIVKV
uniref:Reverse transcriptase domain-containing protein n=1 Tax=Tanacetum cinerariifolium TaxID=118510 RepID=A0A6L2L250_TANCI|nr:reverse transcriptase domain-containing protein [Tanacetum cinerariifolium]